MSSVGVENEVEVEKREGFEEWDADFLDQLIQVEELAISSSSSSVNPNPNNLDLPPPPSFPSHSLPSTAAATIAASTHTPAAVTFSFLPPAPSQQPPQSLCQRSLHCNDLITYSPPRELSQRVVHSNAVFNAGPSASLVPQPNSKELEICLVHKDLENDRLKRELECVSKQLADSEHKCFELMKEKRRKEDQIKSLLSSTEESILGVHSRRNLEYEACTVDTRGIARKSKNGKGLQDQIGYQNDTGALPSSSKIIGVRAGKADDPTEIDDDLYSGFCLSEKLLGIWGCTSYQKLGRNLISKLFMSHMRSCHPLEGAIACDLYSLLAKIGNGLLPLEALVGPLVDLCNVENVPVLRSSIHILHVFLKHLFSLQRKLEGSALYSGTMPGSRDFYLVKASMLEARPV